MEWLITCDFDKLIATNDTTGELLSHYADPNWRHYDVLRHHGIIGTAECLREQISRLSIDPQTLQTFIADQPIDPVFPEFVRTCRAKRLPLVIVSDGIDHVIKGFLNNHGIHNLISFAGHLHQTSEQRWLYQPLTTTTSCRIRAGTCRCTIIQHLKAETKIPKVLHIGAARSNLCATRVVDLTFAKPELASLCKASDRPHRVITNFKDALDALDELRLRNN